MRYIEAANGSNAAPKTILELATAPASGAVTRRLIWDGQTAPTPSARDLSKNAGATVAGGMGKDGYIYAMRAIGTQEPGWDLQGGTWAGPNFEWRTHTRYYEMLRYGRDGVDNLGIVSGLGPYRMLSSNPADVPGAIDARLGPNFNAADIDPVTGIMYLASFQTGGALNRLYRIDVTQTPPQYLSTLTLSANIPGAQSGDFAIDAAGQYAYGVATTGNVLTGTSVSYRIRLSDGNVETLASGLGNLPFGAAARLPNAADKFAFYGYSTRIMTVPAGTLGANQSTASANSADAAACLPKLKAKLECTPTTLVDADNNISTCTITLDQAAPVGGLPIALTPPTSDPRYTTTCGSSVAVAAGQTTAQCTITATPNLVPADGDATANISLSTPDPLADYELDTPTSAVVLVQNDDLPTVTLSCTPATLVDSAGQESVCTISSNVPAPVGGMTVALTPPAGNPRYATTCGASIVLAEGSSSNTCTITATANTVPGDGSVTAPLALQANATVYNLGAPSSAAVVVNDDDTVTPPGGGGGEPLSVPVGGWPVGLGLAALAWARLRKRHKPSHAD